MQFINKLPWGILIIACLTLGLAPFAPPHIWEKLVMLKNGELSRPSTGSICSIMASPGCCSSSRQPRP